MLKDRLREAQDMVKAQHKKKKKYKKLLNKTHFKKTFYKEELRKNEDMMINFMDQKLQHRERKRQWREEHASEIRREDKRKFLAENNLSGFF